MAWIKPRRLLRAPESRVTALAEGHARLEIDGLVCGVCANRVKASLSRLDGVSAVACDLESGTAIVRLHRPVPEDALNAAVQRAAIAQPLRRAIERAARAVGL